MSAGAAGAGPRPRSASVPRYLLGVGVLVLAISSQYFLPQHVPSLRPIYGSLAGSVTVVYVVPVAVFALLVGPGPLRGWKANPSVAVPVGLGWYGAMNLLALVVLVGMEIVYLAFDPGVLHLLSRPNPELQAAAGDPWLYVAFSFAAGAFEETLFRGWVFGFWLARRTPWLWPAILSSALFASLHLYYGTTYGAASPLIFPTLFLLGFAFAATYRSSGGNLVVPAALHGAYDAAGFLTIVSLDAGTAAHWLLVAVAALVGLAYWTGRPRAGPPPELPG